MFQVDPDAGATILTDTLVTGGAGHPMQFTAKCRLVPQMNLAMAGTGSGNLLNAWAAWLNDRMLAVDVDMCADHAARPLTELWEQICTEHGLESAVGTFGAGEPAEGSTATIYHFGQDEQGRFVWYAFRSTSGFEPERFDEGGFAVKPAPLGGFDNVTSTETIDDLIALGIRIRAQQDSLPPERRIWIGGEFWLTVLQPGSFSQVLVHRFDDWLDHWNAMNARRV